MGETLYTKTNLVNGKVLLECEARGLEKVKMDYHPPLGDDAGYTGLEMLLMSLSGCSATAVLPVLRKMNITVKEFSVEASGTRRDTHPTLLENITLKFNLTSPDASPENLERAVKLAEETYCPVWAMLKGNTVIQTELNLTRQ